MDIQVSHVLRKKKKQEGDPDFQVQRRRAVLMLVHKQLILIFLVLSHFIIQKGRVASFLRAGGRPSSFQAKGLIYCLLSEPSPYFMFKRKGRSYSRQEDLSHFLLRTWPCSYQNEVKTFISSRDFSKSLAAKRSLL